MIFNNSQIRDLLDILHRYELVFIAKQLGTSFLTAADKAILLAAGIDVDKYKNKQGIIEHAFLFGMLAEAIGDKRAKNLNYTQFKQFLASKNFIPLTETEEFSLQQLKNRAYTDITNLGARMRNNVSNIVVRNNQQQAKFVADVIKKKAIKAVEMRQGARALAAELARTTKDWEVDWLRIATFLSTEAFNQGRAQQIIKEHGYDAEVYFDVFEEACEHCRELFLIDPSDENSEPIIFKLSDVIANGNNIGVKVADWKPVIPPVHPYCRCILNVKEPNMEWDAKLRAFTKPKKYVSKNPKLQGVKLDIKVTKPNI